ncbi:MAG: CotH kinase family protein [Planctomycetaceae bacterium]|nr:CotH kinase family protein [Planctomycetaceae bacterium]
MAVPAGYKRSLNVSIDLADSKLRLQGYKTLNLLNLHEDDSFLSSVLYSHIANQYLPAPKANLVRVVINGENWGVYCNAQQFNREMLEEHYPSSKGARWKVSGSPQARGGLEYLGDNVEDYKRLYEIKTNDESAWDHLIELCRVLNETPADQLEEALAPMMDIDEALRFLAIDIALMNSDGYWIRSSDYSIFMDENNKFHFLPHDMNEAFRTAMGPGGPGGPGGPPGRGMRGPGGPRGGFEGGPGNFGQPAGPGREGPGRDPRSGGGPPDGPPDQDGRGRPNGSPDEGPGPRERGGRERGGRQPGVGAPGVHPPESGPPSFGPPGFGSPGFGPPGFGPPEGVRGGGPDLDPLTGLEDPRKPLRSKLLAVPALKQRYLDYVRQIAEKSLDWKQLGPVVAQYRALIRDEVQRDTKQLSTYDAFLTATADTPESANDSQQPRVGRHQMSLRSFADQRREYLLKVTQRPAEGR